MRLWAASDDEVAPLYSPAAVPAALRAAMLVWRPFLITLDGGWPSGPFGMTGVTIHDVEHARPGPGVTPVTSA
jgi:hypothetical protein